MTMKFPSLKVFVLPLFLILLTSWGGTGHYNISKKASLSFGAEMSQFLFWSDSLAAHASDPDYRKSKDPDEGHKHYIDIDNYPEFNASGRIALTLDSVVKIHGQSFVDDQGILPWTTKITFDSLRNCFQRKDFRQALLFASDLGHYVADGHMPLHITRNYNGQYSGNTGIHGRYESVMVNQFIGEIKYGGYPVQHIDDVQAFIFDYLYRNYLKIDSLLDADNYAYNNSGNQYLDKYYSSLWEKTKNMTIGLFKSASHSIAELIYTAWVDAGKPDINNTFIHELQGVLIPTLEIRPTIVSDSAEILFSLPYASQVRIEVINYSGKKIEVLVNKWFHPGQHLLQWQPAYKNEAFLIVLYTGSKPVVQKVLVQ